MTPPITPEKLPVKFTIMAAQKPALGWRYGDFRLNYKLPAPFWSDNLTRGDLNDTSKYR